MHALYIQFRRYKVVSSKVSILQDEFVACVEFSLKAMFTLNMQNVIDMEM